MSDDHDPDFDELPDDVREGAEPAPIGEMTFEVRLKEYQERDVLDAVVDRAARLIVGNYGQTQIAKEIEARAKAIVAERVDAELAKLTKEFFDQPILAAKDGPALSIREWVGLAGREFLTQMVNREGKPSDSAWDSRQTRMSYLIGQIVTTRLENELREAVTKAAVEVQGEARKKIDAAISAEKARIRAAFDKVVAEK